jgi:hypothetical protein
MFKVILDRFIWVMMTMQNCWNGKGKNKAMQWKPMVVERGKTCSELKEKSNFSRAVGK